MTRNHATVSPEDASVDQLTAVARVGGVRAYRIRRDLGISTIQQLAECPIDELQDVWSIGEHQSRVIKGSAQGWTTKYEQWVDDAMPDHCTELDGSRRVAVIADDKLGTDRGVLDWFDKENDTDPVALIDSALEMAGIDVTDDPIEIGIVEGTDLCGREVQAWYDRKMATVDSLFSKNELPTFWGKYATVCADDRANEVPPITAKDVPFDDVIRSRDIEWKHAAMERNHELCEWADEVVIVMDGPYASSVRWLCEHEFPRVECFTAFEPAGFEADPDFEVFEPDEDQQVANGNLSRGAKVEEGDDTLFRDEANDTDEGRMTGDARNDIKRYDPGGRGAGKKEDAWY